MPRTNLLKSWRSIIAGLPSQLQPPSLNLHAYYMKINFAISESLPPLKLFYGIFRHVVRIIRTCAVNLSEFFCKPETNCCLRVSHVLLQSGHFYRSLHKYICTLQMSDALNTPSITFYIHKKNSVKLFKI